MKVRALLVLLALGAAAMARPDTLWTRTFGTRYSDCANCVLPDAAGGCAVFGTVGTPYTPWESEFLRYDSSGNLVQEVDLIGRVYCACPAPDGGFFVAGSKRASQCSTAMMVAKLDGQGGVGWTREFGPSGQWYSWAEAVCPTPEGGCVAIGMQQALAGGGEALLAARLDAGGGVEWERSYTGFWVYDGARTTGDEYLAVGARTGGGGAVLVRLQPWGDTIGTMSLSEGSLGSVCPTADGGCVVSSYAYALRLIRLDSELAVVWNRVYWPDTYCSEIRFMPDGGFVLTGGHGNHMVGYDLLVARLNERGEELWVWSCGGDSWDSGRSVYLTADSGYFASGYTESRGVGEHDFWVLRFEQDTVGIAEPELRPPVPQEERPTVMRAVDLLRFEGRVFDMTGRDVTHGKQQIAPGVYFMQPSAAPVRRVLVQR